MLVLFDVDGTLLLTPDAVYVDALIETVDEVWGNRLTDASFADHRPGDTAIEGLRRMLRGEGIDPVPHDLERWCHVFGARYVELLARTSTEHWIRAPQAVGTLEELAREHELALLTGNPEPVARARLERLGLTRFFRIGAFGCDAEHRADLITVARERAGRRRKPDTVLVGDTPRDVEGARAAGVRVVGVTLGAYGREELAEADTVVDDLSALPAAIAALDRT